MATTRKEAKEEVRKRRMKNKKKMIHNESRYAGSSMHYYCKYCCAHTDTLGEGDFWSGYKEVCKDCKKLKRKGLLRKSDKY